MLISPFAALLLGIVEGLTEFLPISSTGHLILAGAALDLDLADPGVGAYLIVIQAGAILAVLGLYRPSVELMLRGLLLGRREGRRLVGLLLIAFLPAAVTGLLFEQRIEAIFADPRHRAIAWALALGGALMIGFEAWRMRLGPAPPPDESASLAFARMTWRMALAIGLAQCLALIPGTSRSMVTILAGMAVGMTPRAAAEFSFLLALPTLGGATVYKLMKEGDHIMEATGAAGLGIGLVVSCVVAFLTMKFFIRYLTRHGLAAFGWYRIALALVVFWVW